MCILRFDNVVKTYEKTTAVDHVTFEIPKGKIFGMLGPNGAGKTSLIRIITTITRADSGTIWLDGEKLNSHHPAQIGYMPEERGLYKKMKVGEQLTYLARCTVGGDVNVPPAKVESMYDPENFALSATQKFSTE